MCVCRFTLPILKTHLPLAKESDVTLGDRPAVAWPSEKRTTAARIWEAQEGAEGRKSVRCKSMGALQLKFSQGACS